ncbi:hypothetical protein SUGI_1084070 [Cryptomeria japonica]|nr:hypothetical protein SUGI_1084070 [Cryptomeria japonica]
MARRGIYVFIALVLLNVSFCTCVTITLSTNTGSLNAEEGKKVYDTLNNMATNTLQDIEPDREYYAGRLFTRYLNLNGKGVVIRLTRWRSQCTVSMSPVYTSKGSEMVEAFVPLASYFQPYLEKGNEWVSVSNDRYWIDYYVRIPYGQRKVAPLQLADAPSYKILSDGDEVDENDCTIKPHMLLSHHTAPILSELHPGDYLRSPDAKYELTFSQTDCVAYFKDAAGRVLWRTPSTYYSSPQKNCYLALHSDGTLELQNLNRQIWRTPSACSSVTKCAGAAALALVDGNVKLYTSVGDHLSVYWTAM